MASRRGFAACNSRTALGLRERAAKTRVRSRCTGKERDSETGLDYFGARYYGTHIGRFLTTDAILMSIRHLGNPQKWNRYAYVRNSPLSFVDLDGLDDWYVFLAPINIDSAGNSKPGFVAQDGNWAGAIQAAEARGDTVHMFIGTAATVAAYNEALQTDGVHVIFVGHGPDRSSGNNLIELADGYSAGNNGSVSNTMKQDETINIQITANLGFRIKAKEVAIFACNSDLLIKDYREVYSLTVTPGFGKDRITPWLGGTAAADFLMLGGGWAGSFQAAIDAERSPYFNDWGANFWYTPPLWGPKPPPVNIEPIR